MVTRMELEAFDPRALRPDPRKPPRRGWPWAREKLRERMARGDLVFVQPGFVDTRIMEVLEDGIVIGSGSRWRSRGIMILAGGGASRGRMHLRFRFTEEPERGREYRGRRVTAWRLHWTEPKKPRASWVKGPCKRCDRVYHLREPWSDVTACGRPFNFTTWSHRLGKPRLIRNGKIKPDWCATCARVAYLYEVRQ